MVTGSIIPAEARCWRMALPRRRDRCSLWYLDTVVDNGRTAISAKNRNSSRFIVLPGGTGMESETVFDLFMKDSSILVCDSLGAGGWVLFSFVVLFLLCLLSDKGIGGTALLSEYSVLFELVSV